MRLAKNEIETFFENFTDVLLIYFPKNVAVLFLLTEHAIISQS
jgi:hypothetical protein